MKAIFSILTFLCCVTVTVYSQNTFPLSGNVGIGTSNPSSTLHVRSATALATFENKINGRKIKIDAGNGNIGITNSSLHLNRFSGHIISLALGGGNVGIGTDNPDAKLTVKGDIHAEEVRVDLTVPGPDYVFEEDYGLPSLESIQNYIQKNKHLPEIPSAAEMEENGIDLGVMNMLLLKKVEELTLYQLESSWAC